MQQNETRFKKKVLKDLGDDYGDNAYVLKTQERGRRGVPDILSCIFGDFIAMELKDEGEKPTPLQEIKLGEIRRAGGMAFSTMPSQWDQHRELLRERYKAKLNAIAS
jgi:hypothetical protein